jgi:hypothetical protein
MMYIIQFHPKGLDLVSRTDYCGEGARDRGEIATARICKLAICTQVKK